MVRDSVDVKVRHADAVHASAVDDFQGDAGQAALFAVDDLRVARRKHMAVADGDVQKAASRFGADLDRVAVAAEGAVGHGDVLARPVDMLFRHKASSSESMVQSEIVTSRQPSTSRPSF